MTWVPMTAKATIWGTVLAAMLLAGGPALRPRALGAAAPPPAHTPGEAPEAPGEREEKPKKQTMKEEDRTPGPEQEDAKPDPTEDSRPEKGTGKGAREGGKRPGGAKEGDPGERPADDGDAPKEDSKGADEGTPGTDAGGDTPPGGSGRPGGSGPDMPPGGPGKGGKGPGMGRVPGGAGKTPAWARAALAVAASVARASKVALTVGPKAAEGKVPNVVGKTYAQAQAALAAAGLTAQATRPKDGTLVVHTQMPVGGTTAVKGGKVALTFGARSALIKVPDVVGKTYAQARAALTAAGLALAADRKAPAGDVVKAQAPAAGAPIARGGKVALTFGARSALVNGPDSVKVPDVVGKPYAQARAALVAAGLAPPAPATASAGAVVKAQAPAAGVAVKKGSRVTLTLSAVSAVTSVKVPDVVGKTYAQAQAALAAAGLTAQATRPAGAALVVKTQSVAAGRSVAKGSKVALTFGPKSSSVKVPDVVGKTYAQAKAALLAVGLTVDFSGPGGAVVKAQLPAAGTSVKKASKVQLTLRSP